MARPELTEGFVFSLAPCYACAGKGEGMVTTTTPLAEVLDARIMEGELYEGLPRKEVRCYACGHRCLIRQAGRGICQVWFHREGTLHVPTGYVAALQCDPTDQCDPTEKKSVCHLLPGSKILTFGMLGCDYH